MSKMIAQNRKVRHDYFIEDKFEAGIMLVGSEVKSLRAGHCSIAESYVSIEDGEVWLINAHIEVYKMATAFATHLPTRRRKLLLNKREIKKLLDKSKRGGYTIVSLSMYFNAKGKVKLEIATGKGKKKHDKRETEKQRDWDRDKRSMLKEG